MTLTEQVKAERAIGDKILVIDAIRMIRHAYGDRFIDESTSDQLMAEVNAEIAELQKITGPRHLQGAGHFTP